MSMDSIVLGRGRGGIALILSRNAPEAARTAFSLALTVVAVGDPAAIFFMQGGVRCLLADEADDELVQMRALCQAEGVLFIACADSLMNAQTPPSDLVAGVELAGAARFYLYAREVAVSLYI